MSTVIFNVNEITDESISRLESIALNIVEQIKDEITSMKEDNNQLQNKIEVIKKALDEVR